MRHYILQFDPMPGSIAWEYTFQMSSDRMAIEYAKNIAKNDPATEKAVLLLFTTEQDAGDALLARFETAPKEVVNTHRKKERAA